MDSFMHLHEFAKTLLCPLCSKHMQSPSTFSTCGHTFCHECVISRLEGRGISTSHCPECKQPGWKKDLQTNHLAQNVLEILKSLDSIIHPLPPPGPLLGQSPAVNPELPSEDGGSARPASSGLAAPEARTECLETCDARGAPDTVADLIPEERLEITSSHQTETRTGAAGMATVPGDVIFGAEWKEAELRRRPTSDPNALKELCDQIALLEAAVELCDKMPIAGEMRVPVQYSNQTRSTQPGPSCSQRTKRKLSEMEHGARENVLPGAPPPLSMRPEGNFRPEEPLGIKGQVHEEDAADGIPRREEKVRVMKHSIERRRLERSMAQAEAAVNIAMRATHGEGHLDRSAAAVVGSRVVIMWKEGPFRGIITEIDALNGMHRILYDDGDVEWHCLDEECYTLEEGVVNDDRGKSCVHDSQQQPTSNTKPVEGDARERFDMLLSSDPQPNVDVIPDSQDDSLVASAAARAQQPDEEEVGYTNNGTQAAAETLQGLRNDVYASAGGGFIAASQLPRENFTRENFSPRAERTDGGTEPTPAPFPAAPVLSLRPMDNLQRGVSSQKTILRPQNGRKSSTTGVPSGCANVKDMLRAATQAAEQASQRSEIYLSFPARDENLVAKVRAFQEFFPGVVHVEKEVSERSTHVLVDTDEYLVAKERTTRFLSGLVRRCWVLSTGWLDACVDAKQCVSEQTYEVRGVKLHPKDSNRLKKCGAVVNELAEGVAPMGRAARDRGKGPLFGGMKVFLGFRVFQETMERNRKLAELVERAIFLGGGIMTEKLVSGSKIDTWVVSEDAESAGEWQGRGFVRAVDARWIVDCITSGRLLAVPQYD